MPQYKLSWKEKILLICLDRIGDAIWNIKIAKIIKKHFPNTKIYVLCNHYNQFVFEENQQLFEKIFILKTNPPEYFFKNPIKALFQPFITFIKNYKTLKKLKKFCFDYKINLTKRIAILLQFFLPWKTIKCHTHKEIWANLPRCWVLNQLGINNNFQIYFPQNKKINKILLFKWWKHPHRLQKSFRKNLENILQKNDISYEILTDYPSLHNTLNLKKTFIVADQTPLKDFIKKFDLVIGSDWWAMHYISQFTKTLFILTATNPYAIDYIKKVDKIWNRKIYQSLTNPNTTYISQNLPCVWCFQLGCKNLYCHKIDKNFLAQIVKKII